MASPIAARIKECTNWAALQGGWKHKENSGVHEKECSACAFERLLGHNIRSIINEKLESVAVNFEKQAEDIDGSKSPFLDWQKTFVLQMGKAMRTLKEGPPPV